MSRLVFLLATATLLGACGSTAGSLCKKSADCEGDWTDGEIGQCEDFYAALEDLAGVVGCKSEYNSAISCVVKHIECTDGELGGDETDCETESNKLDDCLEANGE